MKRVKLIISIVAFFLLFFYFFHKYINEQKEKFAFNYNSGEHIMYAMLLDRQNNDFKKFIILQIETDLMIIKKNKLYKSAVDLKKYCETIRQIEFLKENKNIQNLIQDICN